MPHIALESCVLRFDQPAIRCGNVVAHKLRQIDFLDLPCQPQLLKHPDTVPVQVDLIPFQTVSRRGWMRMMVIVPAFSECQQRNPPTISREVTRGKAAGTPAVSRRVH